MIQIVTAGLESNFQGGAMFYFTVERRDAQSIRSLLDTFPVIYTVRRRWIFWVRFTVDGMDPDAVRMALDAAHGLRLFGLHEPIKPQQSGVRPSVPAVNNDHGPVLLHGVHAGGDGIAGRGDED
jgi:hypothetical protein